MSIIYMSRDLDGNDEPHQAKYYLWSKVPNKVVSNDKVIWCGKSPIGNAIFSEKDRSLLGLPICSPGVCIRLKFNTKIFTLVKKGEGNE